MFHKIPTYKSELETVLWNEKSLNTKLSFDVEDIKENIEDLFSLKAAAVEKQKDEKNVREEVEILHL